MNLIPARQCMIAWKPLDQKQTRKIEVGYLLGEHDRDWSMPYLASGGAAETRWRTATDLELLAHIFIAFNTITVRDRIPIDQAHAEFCKIEEYATHISPDMIGAVHPVEVA